MLTIREVAIRMGATFTYVYSLARADRFHGAYKRDGQWYIPQAAVDEYLQRRRTRLAKASSRKQLIKNRKEATR